MAIKKTIYQYDKDGNFLKEWNSSSDALKSINISSNVSLMKHKNKEGYAFAYNFYWSFEKHLKLNVPERTSEGILRKKVPVYQYSIEGNFIRAWDDILTLEKELNFPSKRIYEVIYGRKKSYKGFRWTNIFYDKLDDYYEKHIFQYSIYGEFIKEWKSINDIIKDNPKITRSNILSALEGKQKTCKNYQWSYTKMENIGAINTYDRKSTVYMYTNTINNKKYIGQTRSNVKSRAGKNGHGYKQSTKFWNAIQKYGWSNFSVKVIAKGLDQIDADALEQSLIESYDSINNGYNIQTGGILSRVRK